VKRNQEQVRAAHNKRRGHKSKYAEKLERNDQMYGGKGSDSCCAHRIRLDYWNF
jgi:hypothetical protein